MIPKAPMKRIAKSVGCERISENAVELLTKQAEDYIKTISEEALGLARYNGRKTILPADIEYVIKHY